MKTVFLWTLILSYFCLMARGHLTNFYDMVRRVTGRNAVPEYTKYGCHCSLAAVGQPLDATDRCCWSHNCCYRKAEGKACVPKMDGYSFKVSYGEIECGGTMKECGRLACECDKAAVLCFKANRRTYNNVYLYKENYACRGGRLAC